MKYRATLSKGMAGRVKETDVLGDDFKPRLGFYWFFLTPQFGWNKGEFKRGEVVDVDISWLCFWVGLTFWPKQS